MKDQTEDAYKKLMSYAKDIKENSQEVMMQTKNIFSLLIQLTIIRKSENPLHLLPNSNYKLEKRNQSL